MSDTDRTDILPWQEDAPPSATQVLQGRHRVRRGVDMPRAAQVVVFGTPIAAVMLTVGLVLPGWLTGGDEPGPVRVSPSPTAAEPSSLEPVVPVPAPSRSRADRSRPRSTETPAPAPSPATSQRLSSPTPTPKPTTPRPSSPPLASPSPTRTGSSASPTPTDTITVLPSPEVSPGQEKAGAR